MLELTAAVCILAFFGAAMLWRCFSLRRKIFEINLELERKAQDLRKAEEQRKAALAKLDGDDEKLGAAERELLRLKALLESALRQMPTGVMASECPSGRTLFANDAASSITGLSHATLMALDIDKIGQMKDSAYELDGTPMNPRDMPLARAISASETTARKEFIIMRPDGTQRIIAVRAAPVKDSQGRVFAALASFTDISVEMRDKDLLKKRTDALNTLIENMSQGVCLFGPDLKLAVYNKKLLELTELPERFLEAHPDIDKFIDLWIKIVNPPEREIVRVRREVLSRETFTREFIFQGKLLELRHSPLPDGGFVRTVSDLTYRKKNEDERIRVEREMLHAQKLESLGVLAGGIAHDFNNLLLAIMGNIELAKIFAGNLPLELTKRLSDAENASLRAADLTRQLLAYSGKGKFQVKRFDLSAMVGEMTSLLRVSISKTATLTLSLPQGLPAVQGDPAQVQQVVMNLIVNASESLEDKAGEIRVSTSVRDCDAEFLKQSKLEEKPAPGRFVVFEVTDTGCGMDESTLKRLFDPFFTTKLTGRGLGMAAVQGIMRAHSGAILIESEKDKGSVFRMLFPEASDAPDKRKESGESHRERERKASKRVSGVALIVDDETMVRELCAAMLVKIGVSPITAANGEEAIAAFKARKGEIACVLLDVSMPGMDGMAVFKELKKIDPKVKIALSSGHSREDVAARFAEEDAAGYIQKPFRIEELKAELARIMEL